MKLIAIIRCKNAMDTLDMCLNKLSELVDEIIILDNGSIDGSVEAYKKFPKIVKVLYTEGYNEGRDKTLLLKEARKRNPDWILTLDIDEVFEKHLTRDILDKYMFGGYDNIKFRMCNFWCSEKYFRFDRDWFKYTLTPQRDLWRNSDYAYFNDVKVHLGGIQGIDKDKIYISPYRLKHYGYASEKAILDKIATYKREDPDNKNYDALNPDIKYIMRAPFIEFNSKILNYIYVLFYDFLCKFLTAAFGFKKKYLKGVKFFPGEERE